MVGAVMRTWLRVLLAFAGALVGMILAVIGEALLISFLGQDSREPWGEIEGTGLVIVAIAPFAAAIGSALGALGVVLLTRNSPRSVALGHDKR